MFEFVWNRKQDRISRKTAVKNIVKGGLGIPNIKNYVNALKLIWIRKLKTSDHKWKSIIKASYPKVLLHEQLGSSLKFLLRMKTLTNFGLVFQAYKEFGRKIYVEKSEELIAEPIFCNDNVQVGKKIVGLKKIKKWIDKGVCCIRNNYLD